MFIVKRKILQVNKGDCTGDYNWYDTCYYETLDGAEIPAGYFVYLNNEWQPLTEDIPLPQDVTGKTYESFSNHYKVGRAKMRIIFKNCPEFKLYYRSDGGSSSSDYLIISKIDTELEAGATYKYATVAYYTSKPNTWYEAVYPNDGGEHFIEIVYVKDSNYYTNLDKGFVFIEDKFLPQ